MCYSEYEKGHAARKRLGEIIALGAVLEHTGKSCKYGLECAYLRLKGEDVAEILSRRATPCPAGARGPGGIGLMSDFNPGLALTLIAFLLAAPAQAAEIKIDAEQRFLVVEGRLVLEDFETFKTKAAQISGGARVFLTSEGGSIAAGIEIGLTSEQDPINTLGACCRPRRKA